MLRFETHSADRKPLNYKLFVSLLGVMFALTVLTACQNESSATTSPVTQAGSTDNINPLNPSANQSNTAQDPTMTNNTSTATSTILLATSLGDITIELDHKNAPISAKNFEAYVASGHYDGVIFHRVIPNFMVQGGGFAIGMVQKPTQAPIVNEANNGVLNNKYTLAMARTNDPHSASSQFFINTKDNDFLNFSSETSQGWGYAVFGKVIDGYDVVDQIEKVATGQMGPHGDVPVTDVVIVQASKL